MKRSAYACRVLPMVGFTRGRNCRNYYTTVVTTTVVTRASSCSQLDVAIASSRSRLDVAAVSVCAVEIHGCHDCDWQPIVMVAAVVNRGCNSEVNSSLRSTILSAASPGLNRPTATRILAIYA